MSFSNHRRQLMLTPLIAGLSGIFQSTRALAQTYPSSKVRMIVPFPPGGPTDIVARPLAKLLGDILKQQVYIDNRGGAGGSIGAEAVATASPDGYTLLMATVGTNAINTTLYKKLPYDVIASFTPISTIASAPIGVVVNPKAGFKSLADLVTQARARPGLINYGSAGNGTPGHLAGAMFCKAAGITLTHVPYKGSSPAITDLIGGQIPLMFDPVQSILPHVLSGKLIALAVTSRTRSSVLSNVPTVSESGYEGFEATAWWAVFAPAKLPPNIKHILTTALESIVRSESYAKRLNSIGVQPLDVPLAAFQKKEIAKWGAAVRETGLSLD
ncbi:tripartite tricarboxylate transporter substrate binding protein [Paralcaligenes sp. KSB-10]|uniref:Bug family tripartite tricarboxylate transporter substrate binding protein n=1 Tax=Paralcaligenes sp. KSB-10 TaxID=2901142 RepID=UPI001E5AA8F8|nr:tripartite tricarboxylate transporter substrate binding protein [Paralcaligenes sp. KSB-10]UHL64780.1 tripartite tricarboxylate transporter substrate binding protein [Paralcaligenes sp. KSB-10]